MSNRPPKAIESLELQLEALSRALENALQRVKELESWKLEIEQRHDYEDEIRRGEDD